MILLSFLISLSIAFISPIFPLYIKSLVHKDAQVGYVISIVAVIFLIANFVVVKYLDLYKKKTLLIIGLVGSAVTIILMGFISELKYFLILEIFRSFFLVSIYITTALLIKENTTTKNIGRIQGIHFTFSNIAFLIGPFIGGLLADKYSISNILIISSLFSLIAFILILIRPVKEDHFHVNNHNHTFKNIKNYFKDKDLRILYYASIGLLMWWTVIYTFVPLYIKNAGLKTSVIGYLLLAVTIPLIIMEIPIGKLADKTGFKKYFFLGFFIISVSALLTYFFNTFTVLVLLVIASIGAAFLEPLREAYLFKKLNNNQTKYKYPVYRTSVDIGQIFGPIIFSTVLLYSNFKIFYVFVGIVMFLFSLLMLRIKDIKK